MVLEDLVALGAVPPAATDETSPGAPATSSRTSPLARAFGRRRASTDGGDLAWLAAGQGAGAAIDLRADWPVTNNVGARFHRNSTFAEQTYPPFQQKQARSPDDIVQHVGKKLSLWPRTFVHAIRTHRQPLRRHAERKPHGLPLDGAGSDRSPGLTRRALRDCASALSASGARHRRTRLGRRYCELLASRGASRPRDRGEASTGC